jgi:hypothetical protein
VIHIFFGHEDKAEAGTTAFVRSVIAHAKQPVALVPLSRTTLANVKEGTNAFTFRRFLVPWMMGYQGTAIFVDGSDMLCRADITEMVREIRMSDAVAVVKHDYQTKHPRKYVGTPMEADNTDYPRKQWASVMVMNCYNFAWRRVTPEFVSNTDPLELLQLRFLPDERIGALAPHWNWLADEHGTNAAAKLIHFTAGIPAFKNYNDSHMADEWHSSLAAATSATGGHT